MKIMLRKISRKRTRLEKQEWEKVRELMPRKSKTRGIQYDALEYLFEHLYEKIDEEELRTHLLEIRGRLQAKGDPVKSAINLAIKDLQRLREPIFELIKIQEPCRHLQLHRYVQLSYTGFDAVVDFEQYYGYLEDVLSDELDLVVRSIYSPMFNNPFEIFPGVKAKALADMKVEAITSSAEALIQKEKNIDWSFVPESSANQSFILLYEDRQQDIPFLGFVADIGKGGTRESQYILYRGEEKLSKLKFLHHKWTQIREVALNKREFKQLYEQSKQLEKKLNHQNLDQKTIFQGLVTFKTNGFSE